MVNEKVLETGRKIEKPWIKEGRKTMIGIEKGFRQNGIH